VIDISWKKPTKRKAKATGRIFLPHHVIEKIKENSLNSSIVFEIIRKASSKKGQSLSY
jgi:molybdenum cofactor biosynthesis enzyme